MIVFLLYTMRYPLILILFVLFSSCNSHQAELPCKASDSFGSALWIGDGKLLPEFDSIFYKDDPAPLFRKEFQVEAEIESATLYITAAGYYQASLNGKRIGKAILDPAWTDYSKRIYYSEYDLSSMIQNGINCIGVTLGNGFYNPLPMRMWGGLNLREALPVGNPVFIAKLVLTMKNGQRLEIITDESWKYTHGPLIRNSVYLGEVYDARKEIPGWDRPDFNDNAWQQVSLSKGPGGVLQKSFFPPVRATDIKIPVSISSPGDGIYMVDMGVNFTGGYNIQLEGQKSDTITFRFGERIYDNGQLNPMTTVCGQIKRPGMGGPGAPDIAWQSDSYIIGDSARASYSPKFTFHTYRYMEISGLESKPEISDIQGIAFNTHVEKRNSFTCSSPLINAIQEATERTFLSNLISVQSDCPAREKFGYGGDLNATSESFIYNFDMQSFYRKTVYDWLDAMNDSLFVDTAPFVGIAYCGLSWESAFLTTQYYLYLYYKDIEIIREFYEADKLWMEKVARIHPNGIVDKGLSDHESLQPVPVELTGTCHYLQCARIMEEFARAMGDEKSALLYRDLAEQLKGKISAMFWEKPVVGNINRQTLFSTLLYHDIIPEDEKEAAADSLLMAMENGPSGHFSTGIFGTKYALEALSGAGLSNQVFEIVNSTSFPGWGFMMDRGATSIWESWEESDNTFSNCHPMFGSVSEWFYRYLGGIRPDPGYPGFSKFQLSPCVPENLNEVHCSYISPFGEVKSSWRKEGKDQIIFDFTIPENSTAMVKLQAENLEQLTITDIRTGKIIPSEQAGTYPGELELEAGSYQLSATYKQLINSQ